MLIAIKLINVFFQVYTLMLFARIIASWFPQLYEYRLMQFVAYYTEPYLNFFRRFIPPLGMIDFSPIVAFICLSFMQSLIINLLLGFVR
ncbi:putative membrane protein [Candidatus Protochlamydia naegleriophila]|uniref:Putative membrane protein n=1 Tax=Candidatus Protochlamydia naegleriophila TaxID=389348 RepID=A0A0U5ENZ0_9BACT|nr:YggT family protein [Candidatus Protochlamydia naegleriophila]CUI15648.1 putative membrane protein [Candidatus Protochlamydia naegleriophila]